MTGTGPSIVFRVDASTQIGSGHVARCRTLAEALSRLGARVEFVCRELPGHLIGQIEQDGYRVTRLAAPAGERNNTDSPLPDPPLARLDAQETRAVLDRLQPDWLIVDHYGIDREWEAAQRPAAKSLLVIDDLANRHHDCDVLLDQNFTGASGADRYSGRVARQCRLLLGPRYALLNGQYATLRQAMVGRRGEVRRVLVFFGATDATDETSKTLRALCSARFAHLAVDVVLGPNHPAPQVVEELVAGRPATLLYRNLPSLAGLMLRSDMAIGAGGITTWERLCLGLPSVVVTVAANQESHTASLADAGLVVWAGRAPLPVEQIAAAVDELLVKGYAGKSIVDGYGTSRVAACVCPPASDDLRLERASASDAELLHDWRNDAQTRSMSFDDAPIPWEIHSQWFATQLADQRVRMFIGKAGALPVGQVRLDCHAREIKLSYAVDPDVRGHGFGTALVRRAVERARGMGAATIRAHVKIDNLPSRRIFNRLGWGETGGETEFIYSLDLETHRPGRET